MATEEHEIEKKFYWGEQLAIRLLTNQAKKTQEFIDTYYDTPTHALTTRDWWLRLRADEWQLKIPSSTDADAQTYQEITNQQEIAQKLRVDHLNKQVLAQKDIHPFMSLYNKRTSYEENSLTISIDSVTSNNYLLQIGEIERLVNQPTQIPEAVQQIILYAKQKDINLLNPEPKKLGVFLKQLLPEHYHALTQRKVLEEQAYQNNPLRSL